MSGKKQKESVPWVLIGVLVVLAGVGVYIVKTVLSQDEPRRKNTTTTVTLLKPPPVQVKPPEPERIKEIPKKEEIIDPGMKNESPAPPNADQDNTPAGDKLGVDAAGGAGSDSFGLLGKKGGRSLLAGGGGFGQISLLNRFAGYSQIVQTEVKKKVMKQLNENGGIPKGKLQAVVRLSVDSDGSVVSFRIIGSSGNHKMDDAVMQAVGYLKISEPPPDGMPRTMDIKISSQG